MEKFVAEKPDLVLELTTLSGEEFTLDSEKQMSSKDALEIIKKWGQLEKKQKEPKANISGLEMIAEELSYIYPKPKEWFLENFDFGTLNDILSHVAKVIGGIKKKSRK